MRYFVVLFTFIVLPFQFAWGAAATYCNHEVEGKHFGHHDHEHHDASLNDPGEANSDPAPGVDSDCGFCHFGVSHPLVQFTQPIADNRRDARLFSYQLNYRSYIPPLPERPNRLLAV